MRIRIFMMATLAMGTTLSAQWLNYPTRGVPRTPDGKPNLSAPAPRTADGRPDLSGVWQLETSCAGVCGADYPAAPEFSNLGAKLPGKSLPYQPWAAALVKERMAALGKDDPVGFCKPAGAVRLLTFPPYRKFIQLPDLFVILSERDVTFRQVFLDGRPLPNDRLRPSTDTRLADGTATRSSFRRTGCAERRGSIEAAVRSAKRRR